MTKKYSVYPAKWDARGNNIVSGQGMTATTDRQAYDLSSIMHGQDSTELNRESFVVGGDGAIELGGDYRYRFEVAASQDGRWPKQVAEDVFQNKVVHWKHV